MKSYLYITAAMVIWSTWGPMIRWMALPPVVVLFYTSLVASVTVPSVLAIRGNLSLKGIGKAWWLFALLALAFIVNNLSYFYALGHTSVSNAVFTHYTAPVFVALLAPVIISERLQRITVLSLPIAAAGMAMIALAGEGFRTGGAHMPGIIAGTVSGVAYAFLIIFSRELSRMLMHNQAIVAMLWATTVVMAPVVALNGYHLTAGSAALLLACGLFHSTLAPLLYYSGLRRVMAQHAAILGYMEPLAAIPLAYLLLAESPAPAALLGGLLILVSGYLVIHFRPDANG